MKKNNRGFTLAELLIVVAIIAVLVDIAIPVFTTQLEKSRESTDMANLRSAYAAAQVAALTGYYGTTEMGTTNQTLYFNPSADGSLDANGINCGQGTTTDGKADLTTLPSVCSAYTNSSNVKGQRIEVKFKDNNGAIESISFVAAASGTGTGGGTNP